MGNAAPKNESDGLESFSDHFWRNPPRISPPAIRSRAVEHVIDACGLIRRGPISFFGAAVAVGLLSIFMGLYLLAFAGTKNLLHSLRESVALSVYLNDGASQQQVDAVRSKISESPGVKGVNFRSKEAALSELKQDLGGDANLLTGLEQDNPLPASFDVEFSGEDFGNRIFILADQLKRLPEVERVSFGKAGASTLIQLMKSVSTGGTLALLFLMCLLSVIVGITIRLFMHGSREDIRVMKILGGSDVQIGAPFLIQAALLGLCGGLVGVFVLSALVNAFGYFAATDPYLSSWNIRSRLGVGISSALVIFSVLSAFGGSLLVIRNFLKDAP